MADRTNIARRIMIDFANRTGIVGAAEPQRYLWTDAFAVCNFLELAAGGDRQMMQCAIQLVDQVHRTLGRHRPDSGRHGWISGLGEEEGARSPTAGGLRIGKPRLERPPTERFDERLEWERDGQYFHYLTKWIHALNLMAGALREPTYHRWAVDLAHAAHAGFVHRSANGELRMSWKMSVDLSRPLVGAMGHHDPLDALITFHELQSQELSAACADALEMCSGRSWVTDDALGLGGLLLDASRVSRLAVLGVRAVEPLLGVLLQDANLGLAALLRQGPFERTAHTRLAFREFGLSIGLRALPRVRQAVADHPHTFSLRGQLRDSLDALVRYERLADQIEEFWLTPRHQAGPSWNEHRNINEVMLATSLAPTAFIAVDEALVAGPQHESQVT